MANRLSVNSGEMHKENPSNQPFFKDDNDDFSSHLILNTDGIFFLFQRKMKKDALM